MSGRVLAVVTVRLAQNGIAGYALKSFEAMGRPMDFVTIAEPEAELRARIESRGGRLFVLPMRNRNPLAYVRALSGIVRAGGYTIVHCHGNSATLATDLLGAKRGGAVCRIAHAHNTGCEHMALHRMLRPLMLRLCTHRFACGAAAGRFLYGRSPFSVHKNGVDTEAFAFSEAARRAVRQELGLADGARVIGTVGALSEVKDPLFLLDAFALLHRTAPEARLLFVGGGPLAGALREGIARLELDGAVLLTGVRRDVPRLLSAMDVFALPSMREGFPIALIEARCSGLPCAVADAVTRDADVTGDMEFLSRDVAVWARALGALLPQEDAARSDAHNAVREAGFDLTQTAAALADAYAAMEASVP